MKFFRLIFKVALYCFVYCLFISDISAKNKENFDVVDINNLLNKYDNDLNVHIPWDDFFKFDDPNPLPEMVNGVDSCLKSLNGHWHVNTDPRDEFWKYSGRNEPWRSILVPGEGSMQGFAIEYNKEFAYNTQFVVPRDFANKQIFIRFDGVYSYARVWVNGNFVRDHHGGFTAWDCNITPFVVPGDTAIIHVGVTDLVDDISYGSGYAFHPIGGILRNVTMYCLPLDYVKRFNINTVLDNEYKNAKLSINIGVSSRFDSKCEVRFDILEPDGSKLLLSHNSKVLTHKDSLITIKIFIKEPALWDAEHPELYTCIVTLWIDGKPVQKLKKKFGFREIKVKGNQLFVNGKSIRLRGACRHDIHPVYGRTTTPMLDKQDVLLAKDANMNFIRTSHYPPTDSFLEYCDEYGLYVEEETAVCFVATNRSPFFQNVDDTQDDPAFTYKYLNQLHEMVSRDRDHPSVIIWSIGNENKWGKNFAASYDYLTESDTTRPVMFSYPHMVPDELEPYDIYSVHYPFYHGSEEKIKSGIRYKGFGDDRFPVLSDEWAHVACYNLAEITLDPNVRDFWGHSIQRMWDNCYDTNGALGGAIWGMIDEIFMLPDTCVGYGEWGIIDVWRRKKPEFWHTKKAYSPVKIQDINDHYIPGKPLELSVQNRFDHTNLDEISFHWEVNNQSGIIDAFDLAPHQSGDLEIPAKYFKIGDSLKVIVKRSKNDIVDIYKFCLGTVKPKRSILNVNSGLKFNETDTVLSVYTQDFEYQFNKNNGLLLKGQYKENILINGGPWINLNIPQNNRKAKTFKYSSIHHSTWDLKSFYFEQKAKGVDVYVNGLMDTLNVHYQFTIHSNGLMIVDYQIQNPPEQVQELGLLFTISEDINKVSWKRDGLWTVYPSDHIGRLAGSSIKTLEINNEHNRIKPDWPWSMDTKHYINDQSDTQLSNDFASSKQNIWYYILQNDKDNSCIYIDGQADISARTSYVPKNKLGLIINHILSYPNLEWGNYEGNANPVPGEKYSVKLWLTNFDNIH